MAWSNELHPALLPVLQEEGHLVSHYTAAIGQLWLPIMGQRKSGWVNARHMAVQLHKTLR